MRSADSGLTTTMRCQDTHSHAQTHTIPQTVLAKISATGGYHKWALFPDVATVPFATPGLAVLTVNITGIDDYEDNRQFGNVLYLDFE